MKRKILNKLIEWKNKKKKRLPLVLNGARQVGKTYILKEFAKSNFDNLVYMNFEQNPLLQSFFNEDISPEILVNKIQSYYDVRILPEKTIIFFDEIQVCERALTSLKYFAESETGYVVVAAGSLLGIAVRRDQFSFPVGKIQIETLYPFDFEEFLWALGRERLSELIRKGYEDNQKLDEAFHKEALELYNTYLVVGGMPAVILDYRNNKNFAGTGEIQSNILNSYVADMAKYTTSQESVKIRAAFDSIPAQLAKDNKKFQYKIIKKGASASYFGSAMDWLTASGIVQKCYRISEGIAPIATSIDLSAFKIYMTDTGLLSHKAGITHQMLMVSDFRQSLFKGALVENYVAAALASNLHSLYYWESQSVAEIDFVLTLDSSAIPVEVKASDNVKSRSLSVFREKYKPAYAIRLSCRNFGLEGNMRSIPLYAAFVLEK